jgi:adenosylcobinamide amidohydrolase
LINSIELLRNDILFVKLREKLLSLGTNIYGGGLRKVDSIIVKKVNRRFGDPRLYAKRIAKELGSKEAAVFLTSVDLRKYIYVEEKEEPNVYIISTIGLNNPACLDNRGYGTVNLAVITDEGLSVSGILDLFRITSEIKASLITILGLSCGSEPAFGTTSDVTLVLSRHGNKDCNVSA